VPLAEIGFLKILYHSALKSWEEIRFILALFISLLELRDHHL
jgi:hypothetical protein